MVNEQELARLRYKAHGKIGSILTMIAMLTTPRESGIDHELKDVLDGLQLELISLKNNSLKDLSTIDARSIKISIGTLTVFSQSILMATNHAAVFTEVYEELRILITTCELYAADKRSK